MTEHEIIKAVAELDGITPIWFEGNKAWVAGFTDDSSIDFKPYLTSRDAIVPVIEKLGAADQRIVAFKLIGCAGSFEEIARQAMLATPSQLCEALLRATGKWKS